MNWKRVKGWPLYSISDTGIVMSRKLRKPMKPGVTAKGYFRARLSNGHRSRSIFVHRLVAEAFIPNPNGHAQINHKDGNKLNNDVSNLEWCTQSTNMLHAYKHKLKVQYRGSKHGRARLSNDDVLLIRILRINSISLPALAKRFNVSTSNVECIVKRKTWTHI